MRHTRFSHRAALVVAVGVLALVGAVTFASQACAYDRDAAATWADNHWDSTSNAQANFPGYISGADCTNYASAALQRGGLNMGGNWWCRWNSGWTHGVAWVNANELRLYFWGKSGVSEVGSGYNWYGDYGCAVPTNQIAMVRGDVVSLNENKNTSNASNHTEFGVGYGYSAAQANGTGYRANGDLIDQHTGARYHALWHCRDRKTIADMRYYVFRVWHLSNSFTN
jgi:hypothetical protein